MIDDKGKRKRRKAGEPPSDFPEVAGEDKDMRVRRFRMWQFVESYAQGHSVSFSAKKAGVTRQTIRHWRNEYVGFDDAVDAAREVGSDFFEDKLYDAAREGSVAAIKLALLIRGRIQTTTYQDTVAKPDTTVEVLAQKALESGYVAEPEKVTA